MSENEKMTAEEKADLKHQIDKKNLEQDAQKQQHKWQFLHSRNTAGAMYHPGEKKLLIRCQKYVEAKDLQLPRDVDAVVEDAYGNKALKYPYAVSVKVGGVVWMKADRDAVREFFPEIAPKPRAATYRER
jgi:hypothetical protein